MVLFLQKNLEDVSVLLDCSHQSKDEMIDSLCLIRSCLKNKDPFATYDVI